MNTTRQSSLAMEAVEFKAIGHRLIDEIGDFLQSIALRPVTTGETADQLRPLLPPGGLPETGTPATGLIDHAAGLLFDHSLFNGHPRFLGYITASAAPLGILAELLAAAVNPNVGARILSPMATEIEKQTVGWLAELIGVGAGYGGLLVSGGNVANFTGFLAGRTAQAPKNFKRGGLTGLSQTMTFFCPKTTHTWVEKAAVLFGHGQDALRWIPVDEGNRMDLAALEAAITRDLADGHQPFLVVGTAGDVSTGAVDDLAGIAEICRRYDLWFHVDGAYGAPAAALPELHDQFAGLELADSIALDPHKWLYSPLEAGCVLVREPRHLTDTFSSHPDYYNFEHDAGMAPQNFYEYGLQNSRGFRALKVWLMLQHAGRQGYVESIREDIALARALAHLAAAHPELEAVSQHLSIATFRYVPADGLQAIDDREAYLNRLNESLSTALQAGGEVFLSNAIVRGKYCLRGCIVNFRTSAADLPVIVEVVVREGRRLHREAMTAV